ncbi:MAG TPA: HoxN/HupN/NixA family nickel/cobalt transporter [Pseudonocardiaceae bacterium]
MTALVLLLHVVAWGVLILLVMPHHIAGGAQVFGIGLGITAYTLGLRHAFDADHVAAIDDTTRKLMAEGRRPVSVGFWFAIGHSTVVLVLAAVIAAGAHIVTTLTSTTSDTHEKISMVSSGVSGLFLYLIAGVNLVALIGPVRVWRAMRRDGFDKAEPVVCRIFANRFLDGLTRAVTRPGQMYPVGVVFGLGFDTATEVTLLVLAGSGAAAGLPWYAVGALPLLFAAGMSLPDTIHGTFLNVAHHWAVTNPARKVYNNITVTVLSVAVALIIGSIELVAVLHEDFGIDDPVTTWIARLNLNNVGFLIVGLFLVVWALAIAYWRIAKPDHRWSRH